MAVKKDKSGGRDVIVSLVTESAALTTGALVVGTFYAIVSIGTATTLPTGFVKNKDEGKVFCCEAATTLAEGDSVIPLSDPWLKANMLGFANSKDISHSKSTFDATVDEDDDTDTRSDGLTTRSGNVNGIKLNNEDPATASARVQAQFIPYVYQDADGVEVTEQTTPIVLLAFIYTKTKTAGNRVEIVFLPATLSTNGDRTSYGGATSMSLAYNGNSQTDSGTKPTRLSTLIPATV